MPSITATADNVKAQVRLDLDFTDVDAPYALVNRVNPVTGETTQVRGHGSTVTVDGLAYTPMQAGYKAVLYDTELPLDTAFYYTAHAPTARLNATSEFSGGYIDPWFATTANTTVRITGNTSGDKFLSFFTSGGVATPTIRGEDIPVNGGAGIAVHVEVSSTGANGMNVGLDFRDPTGAVIGSVSNGAVVSSTTVFEAFGVAPGGSVTVQPWLQYQGTPGAGVTASVSLIYVFQAASDAASGGVHIPSSGAARLKDPLRPGNNVRVDFAFDANPLCTPTEGVFWQSLDTESYASNSAVFNVNNQVDPVVVSKVRSSPTSTLTLVSRTFADRDRLLTLLAPGSPLLFQAPDEFGLPDRYLAISTDSVSRVLPDHRIPIRVFSLPHAVCAAPGGPMQGTVGARWSDTCNRYASWAAVQAAGIDWNELLDGLAG